MQWSSVCICFSLSWSIRAFKVKVWTKPNRGRRSHVISRSNHMTFSVASKTNRRTPEKTLLLLMCAVLHIAGCLSVQWSYVCWQAAGVVSFCRVLCRFSSLWPRWGDFFARYDVQAGLQTVVGIPADPARDLSALLVRINHLTPCSFIQTYWPFVQSIM